MFAKLWSTAPYSVCFILDTQPKSRPLNMEKLQREFEADFLLEAATLPTAAIGRVREIIFNFPIKEKEVKTVRISSKRLSLRREKNIRLCGSGDDDVNNSAGSGNTGNPFSIYFGWDDVKEKLNTSGTTVQSMATTMNHRIIHG